VSFGLIIIVFEYYGIVVKLISDPPLKRGDPHPKELPVTQRVAQLSSLKVEIR